MAPWNEPNYITKPATWYPLSALWFSLTLQQNRYFYTEQSQPPIHTPFYIIYPLCPYGSHMVSV